jgi:hypothetical protein
LPPLLYFILFTSNLISADNFVNSTLSTTVDCRVLKFFLLEVKLNAILQKESKAATFVAIIAFCAVVDAKSPCKMCPNGYKISKPYSKTVVRNFFQTVVTCKRLDEMLKTRGPLNINVRSTRNKKGLNNSVVVKGAFKIIWNSIVHSMKDLVIPVVLLEEKK